MPAELGAKILAKHYAMAEPIPLLPEVQSWCDENLREGVVVEAIYTGGPQSEDDFTEPTFDYYANFQNEVDMVNFKCRWF